MFKNGSYTFAVLRMLGEINILKEMLKMKWAYVAHFWNSFKKLLTMPAGPNKCFPCI